MLARILPRCQILQIAKRTNLRIKIRRRVGIRFVAAMTNGLPPATIKTLEFIAVNRQVFILGFEMVVLADQRAGLALRILFASASWRKR